VAIHAAKSSQMRLEPLPSSPYQGLEPRPSSLSSSWLGATVVVVVVAAIHAAKSSRRRCVSRPCPHLLIKGSSPVPRRCHRRGWVLRTYGGGGDGGGHTRSQELETQMRLESLPSSPYQGLEPHPSSLSSSWLGATVVVAAIHAARSSRRICLEPCPHLLIKGTSPVRCRRCG